jgi:hypothetical protein
MGSECCKTGKTVPRREPSVRCEDQRKGVYWLYIDPDALLLLQKYGIDPCDVPQAGGDDVLRPQDVQGYLKQKGYTS